MARSVKRVVLVLLAAAVLAFAAWMLWPRSIGDAVDLEGEDFYGFLVTLDVRDGQSQTDSESYTVSADSEQAEAILELLDQYTYHFCWDTLTVADVISEIGDIIVDLDASGDLERKLPSPTAPAKPGSTAGWSVSAILAVGRPPHCANSSPLSSGANRGLQTESRVFIMRGLSGADSPIFVCFGRDLL